MPVGRVKAGPEHLQPWNLACREERRVYCVGTLAAAVDESISIDKPSIFGIKVPTVAYGNRVRILTISCITGRGILTCCIDISLVSEEAVGSQIDQKLSQGGRDLGQCCRGAVDGAAGSFGRGSPAGDLCADDLHTADGER